MGTFLKIQKPTIGGYLSLKIFKNLKLEGFLF